MNGDRTRLNQFTLNLRENNHNLHTLITPMLIYADTSALVKLYVAEVGSSWLQNLCDATSGNIVATATITRAEAAAAFASKLRQGNLLQSEYQTILNILDHDFIHDYTLVSINDTVVDRAVALTQRQKLRGYDAIQLAAGLSFNDYLVGAGLVPLTFIASDGDLLTAAQSEGLSIDDPNLHP